MVASTRYIGVSHSLFSSLVPIDDDKAGAYFYMATTTHVP
jgi:hypothetical protein